MLFLYSKRWLNKPNITTVNSFRHKHQIDSSKSFVGCTINKPKQSNKQVNVCSALRPENFRLHGAPLSIFKTLDRKTYILFYIILPFQWKKSPHSWLCIVIHFIKY